MEVKTGKIGVFPLYLGRYRAYRTKYGRFRAFWRGVILSWAYTQSKGKVGKGIVADDLELIHLLVTVKLVGVRLGTKE
jgi:hypothetical protein